MTSRTRIMTACLGIVATLSGVPILTSAIAAPLLAEPGFSVSAFTTTIVRPDALGFGEGGAFGNDLYVTTSGQEIYRVNGSGVPTLFTTVSGQSAPLDGLAFGSGINGWSNNLFISKNQNEITQITSGAAQSQFSPITDTAGGLERGLGAFGDDLFYGSRAGFIGRLDNAGNASVFASGLNGFGEAIVFAPASPGSSLIAMYASTGFGNSSTLYRIDSAGAATVLATGVGLHGITYDSSGLMGGDLFVGNGSDNSIYRVSLDGIVSLFASGFGSLSGSESLAFGPDGALYISDGISDTIWRISAIAPAPGTFDLLSPPAGFVGLSTPETIMNWPGSANSAPVSWSASTGSATYTFTIALDPALTGVVFQQTGLAATSFNVPLGAIQGGRRYYWGVTAVNLTGSTPSTTPSYTFTTATPADLNGDGVVNAADLATLLATWGLTP